MNKTLNNNMINVQNEIEIKQKALLICIQFPEMEKGEAAVHIKELENLVDTMGAETAGTMIVPLKKRSAKFFVGSGKADEITELARKLKAELIIFDNELSPAQQRNLEELSGKAVIDRHEVILDIFASRASTREAMLQVQPARLQSSLPRLTRAWTHLSRQRGGAKGTRGEGEQQIEVDRRLVKKRITMLTNELKEVTRQRQTQRKAARDTMSPPPLSSATLTPANHRCSINWQILISSSRTNFSRPLTRRPGKLLCPIIRTFY